jgi:EAL domain-containing protein (putative c-di-GMP-specific phosphodiesterase class I)
MHASAVRRLALENQLRGAIERDELSVVFQPLFDLRSEALIRFEALCRWNNREFGAVSPAEFIPIAEECGLIADIGNFVLRTACRHAASWQSSGHAIRVAVNVSLAQFASKRFVEEVIDALDDMRLPHHLLELEITESTLMDNVNDSVRKMQRLRDSGIKISIDDFGTGYSSLSYLQSMPVECLKIDRSFISRLDCDPAAAPMVRSIIALGHALGLRVVSEGVENQAQVTALRSLGSDEVQGYYFGRPEPASFALERVQNARSEELVEA